MKKELVKSKIKPKLTRAQQKQKALREVKKLNRIFNNSTPAEKRIIIARDVITQIEAGKYIPESGTYFETSCNLPPLIDFQSKILEKNFKCRVCELGGLFTSAIRINDKFKTSTSDILASEIREELVKYFSEKQLILIEYAFESTPVGNLSGLFGGSRKRKELSLDKLTAAEIYRSNKKVSKHIWEYDIEEKINIKLTNDANKKAMIYICRNIINNKGTFRPER